MKLSAGYGLDVYVPARHVIAVTNYRLENSESPMPRMSVVHLVNGLSFLVEGNAATVYSMVELEWQLTA